MSNRDTDRFGHGPSALEFAVLEWLLDGDDPEMVPPPWDGVAALVSTLRAPITYAELEAHERALALFRSVADWRRHEPDAGRGRSLSAKVSLAAGCVSVAASVGALPAPAQRVAHATLSAFGVDIPDPAPSPPARPPADSPLHPGAVPAGVAGRTPPPSSHAGVSGGAPATGTGGAAGSAALIQGSPTGAPTPGAPSHRSPGVPGAGSAAVPAPTGGGNPAGGTGGSPAGNANGHAVAGGPGSGNGNGSQGNAGAPGNGNAGNAGNAQGNGNGGSGQGHTAPSGGAVTTGAPAGVTPDTSPASGHGNSAHTKP